MLCGSDTVSFPLMQFTESLRGLSTVEVIEGSALFTFHCLLQFLSRSHNVGCAAFDLENKRAQTGSELNLSSARGRGVSAFRFLLTLVS